jgi:glyoxylase-like metal-dependent hydrolase (beta-lactamase superfamily II)
MLTTSTILARPGEALLVDPAWLPDELEALASFVAGRGMRVVGGFATHAHHDHLLWHPRFGDAPRWASAPTAERARSERASLVARLDTGFPRALVELMGRVDAIAGGIPESAGFEIELIEHDGHAPGHTALWLPRERVLIAGDMLSDVELPLPFDPDDVPAYLAGLDVLAPLAAQAAIVVPGHGHVGADALARLDADRRYLEEMLRRGESDDRRRANPGMDEEYRNLQRVVGGGE